MPEITPQGEIPIRHLAPIETGKPPRDVERQIEALLRHRLRYEDAPAAREFLRQVVDGSELADVKTRVRAAETLLKVGGYVAPRPDMADDRAAKDTSRMSRAQLHDMLQRAQAELAMRATTVINAQIDAPDSSEDVDSLG